MMKYLGLLVKVALSVGLLALLAPRIDFARLVDLLLHRATLAGILLSTLALSVQSLLAAKRQVDLIALLGRSLGFGPSLRVWLSGLLVSQVLVTFIAGDVVRGMQIAAQGIPRRIAGRAVVLDRVIGLAVLLVLVLLTVPFVLQLVHQPRLRISLLLLSVASAAGVACFLAAGFLGRMVRWLPDKLLSHRVVEIAVDLASVSRFLFANPRLAARIAGLSAVMHLLNVLGVVMIATCLGVKASPWMIGAITVPVMLLSMLPVSFAGWGVREAALVTGLGLLQVPADIALTISVSFGLSLVVASLPGVPALMRVRAGTSADLSAVSG